MLQTHIDTYKKLFEYDNLASEILSWLPIKDLLYNITTVNKLFNQRANQCFLHLCKKELGFEPKLEHAKLLYFLVRRLTERKTAPKALALLQQGIKILQDNYSKTGWGLFYLSVSYLKNNQAQHAYTTMMKFKNRDIDTSYAPQRFWALGKLYTLLSKDIKKHGTDNIYLKQMEKLAKENFALAAKANFTPAQISLAKIHWKNDNVMQAIELLAPLNDPETLYLLGKIYRSGLSKESPEYKHAYLMKILCEEKIQEDFINYKGKIYVIKDDQKALSYFHQAALDGYPKALRTLGLAYRDGDLGLQPDAEQAENFLKEASLKFDKSAIDSLSDSYKFGRGNGTGFIARQTNTYFNLIEKIHNQNPSYSTRKLLNDALAYEQLEIFNILKVYIGGLAFLPECAFYIKRLFKSPKAYVENTNLSKNFFSEPDSESDFCNTISTIGAKTK